MRFADTKNKSLPETHTGSKEALGLFLGATGGAHQKELRKGEERRE